jgi:hypothetical protein
VLIGDRIRAIREVKKLSQGDVETRRPPSAATFPKYGHTMPSVEIKDERSGEPK